MTTMSDGLYGFEQAANTMLDFTKPHVLRNQKEYDAAVSEVDRLLDEEPAPESEAYERLEFLSVLIQAYEDMHLPEDPPPDAPSIVDFMLEQHGLSRSDLGGLIGGKNRVSEFFNGHRRLSLNQIKQLRQHLGIPADLLIDNVVEYERSRS